jgi:Fe-S cluster assembly iron-binding protein IscA
VRADSLLACVQLARDAAVCAPLPLHVAVDFESDLMRSAFVIQDNPNAASSCGCGSSFVAK